MKTIKEVRYTWLKEANEQAKMVGRLPVMKYKGKHYYVDERLGEIRNINDFMDRLLFEEVIEAYIEETNVPWEDVKQRIL